MARQKSNTRFWHRWAAALNKTSARQWVSGLVVFLGLLAILVIDFLPTGVSVEVGQVARRDIEAPRTAINSAETARLKEEAGRRAVLEAYDDPAYYGINHATVLKVEENITAVLNLLRATIPVDQSEAEGSEPLAVAEVDRRLIRDYNVDLLPSNLTYIRLSLSEFDEFAQKVTNAILTQMNEEITEDGLRDAWISMNAHCGRRDGPTLEHTALY